MFAEGIGELCNVTFGIVFEYVRGTAGVLVTRDLIVCIVRKFGYVRSGEGVS